VDGTGSGSCLMVGFGISGVEISGSVTRELFSYYRTLCCNSDCLSWIKMTKSSLKTPDILKASELEFVIIWLLVEIYSTCS
jgi:hypothetical protein